ncbi:MAG: hypothetical protein ABIK98_07975 [Pseudomonadota bacterium]
MILAAFDAHFFVQHAHFFVQAGDNLIQPETNRTTRVDSNESMAKRVPVRDIEVSVIDAARMPGKIRQVFRYATNERVFR